MEQAPQVVTFKQEYHPYFIKLNKEWIETYFKLEAMDLIQLENPYEHILDGGGEIFFVIDEGEVVGTCAMIVTEPGVYELAKMAVSTQRRGRGYGDLMMSTAIEWAKTKKAKKIMLLSNTSLEPAITLYKKHGFQTVSLGETNSDYQRADIEMELNLK